MQGLTSSTSSSLSYPSQIEVTLLTAQSPPLVRQYIERVVDHLDLQHLKKISAVCINSPERLIEQCGEGQESPVQEGSLSQNQPSPSELGRISWQYSAGRGGCVSSVQCSCTIRNNYCSFF